MVRCLLDPYPNVSISLSDCNLLIQEIKKCNNLPEGFILNENPVENINNQDTPKYLHLLDGYCVITKYKIKKLD